MSVDFPVALAGLVAVLTLQSLGVRDRPLAAAVVLVAVLSGTSGAAVAFVAAMLAIPSAWTLFLDGYPLAWVLLTLLIVGGAQGLPVARLGLLGLLLAWVFLVAALELAREINLRSAAAGWGWQTTWVALTISVHLVFVGTCALAARFWAAPGQSAHFNRISVGVFAMLAGALVTAAMAAELDGSGAARIALALGMLFGLTILLLTPIGRCKSVGELLETGLAAWLLPAAVASLAGPLVLSLLVGRQ